MARLTRQEILKEDRFMLVVDRTRHFFIRHRKQFSWSLSLAGGSGLLAMAFFYYSAQQEEQSKDELATALTTYHAPISQAAKSKTPEADVRVAFATSARKYEQALVELRGVITRHGTRSAGKIATYFAGLCLHELDRNPEAIKQLKPLSREASDLGALALAALARIYEDSLELAKATDAYEQLVDRDALTTPGETTAMHLALLYERQDKNKEAVEIYEKVIKNFPDSRFSSQAEQRLKKIAPY